ncbi:2'-5' RNA ligase family protein [Micromonospora echinofusca]|uniref:2'-5' RNA ligase family protein n=1 Tax=Micromonospora echinofusca TaxID=47858 RepID=A0ABS3VWY9_MICEH|nr:2'-5' RNA ligase family protein [Micromonospora echinofusca]MBO4209052.1 2'-5' RNA ligase family protein [Micromonospora echinofusca]
MRTVELLCCPALERAVRAAWERLAQAGLPSLARNTHPTNRPHLTLASADHLPPDVARRLAGLLADALPLTARPEAVDLLDGVHPLVWRLAPAPELLALQAAVWRALDGVGGRNPWHEPGRWTPHLSLALRFGATDLGRGRAVVGAPPPPGRFVAARSYDSTDRSVVPF